MSEHIRAQATVTTTAGGLRLGATTLPPDLLAQAARRLGLISLVYGATYSVAFYGPYAVQKLGGEAYPAGLVEHWVAAISVGASRQRKSPSTGPKERPESGGISI